ncbi:MAG: Vi polysaccharide biosynthesis protein VipA/TviB [SAR86 cluster bacterium]|uniref:Vi polysaccharide biosynthesis protein VipA/TviB n=1 Tax=SAR86 cluster bacterium TaxID=2030880 RepID=A0A2A5B7J5_9GAMM|nr:MAG: Vi polysaccharide biosynthesis protein VipA/TviB [SAR86 cluster bacterium]
MELKDCRIAVIGLGYVGLPLLIEFGKKFPCQGFDIQTKRIDELGQCIDTTNEMSKEELGASEVSYTSDPEDLRASNIYIVTVPTPIDKQNRPNLHPLESASKTVGQYLSKGDIVIYESTVYPGATEEVCVPILEAESGLKFNEDFFAGYSPERINPGDKVHRIHSIVKVTAGSTPEVTKFVDELYKTIITAGTHNVSTIKVAEAAKVIENTQRDLNIALINELCIIFEKLGINTEEVLQAAGSKWNFQPFRPGLVGGHCISVDPYYLTHKAQEIGYHPEVILAGRRINDGMGTYIVDRIVRLLTQKRIHVVDSRILVMGLSFKENCPDLRNTRVVDVVEGLSDYHTSVDVYDPWVNSEEAMKEYGISLIDKPEAQAYDAVIITVAHDCFRESGIEAVRSYCKAKSIIFDVKYLFSDQADVNCL